MGEEDFLAELRGTFAREAPDRAAERERALQSVLAAGGGSFDGLVAVLRDRRVARATREDALEFIGRLEDRRVTPVLLDLLIDRASDLRESVAWWLGHRRDKRGAPAMLARLRDATEDPAVRRAVGFALGALGSTRPVRALIRLMRGDPDEGVREAAAYALAFIGDRRVFEPLLRALEDAGEAPLVRSQAAEGLANLRHPRALPALLGALADSAPAVRFWAAFALGEVAGAGAIPALEGLASDGAVVPGWWTVGKEATDAITNIRERLARP